MTTKIKVDEPTEHRHAPAILGFILVLLVVIGAGLWGKAAWQRAHDSDERDRGTTELSHALTCALARQTHTYNPECE